MPRKLHWVCDAPSPYNTHLFQALAADPDIDLTVYYIQLALESHPWRALGLEGYRWRELDSRRVADWRFIRLVRSGSNGLTVIAGWYEPTTQIALSVARRPFAVLTDTPRIDRTRPPLKAVVRSAWLKWIFRRATFVMGTGMPALDALERMGSPRSKLVNFPYFIDVDEFRPPSAPRDEPRAGDGTTPLTFVSSGRLHPVKGYDVALRALAKVFGDNLQRFRYRIAGVGPEERRLRALAESLGIGDRVEMIGWLEPDALPEFYRSGDVLIHPARQEPYGVAVLEAMATGLAVLASDATGAALDRIQQGTNGYVHPVDGIEVLAGQIDRIDADRGHLASLRLAARRTAEEWPIARAVAIVKRLLHADRQTTEST